MGKDIIARGNAKGECRTGVRIYHAALLVSFRVDRGRHHILPEKPESFVFIIFIPPRMPRVMERGSPEKQTRSEPKPSSIGNKLRAYKRRERGWVSRQIQTKDSRENCPIYTNTGWCYPRRLEKKMEGIVEQLDKCRNIICCQRGKERESNLFYLFDMRKVHTREVN